MYLVVIELRLILITVSGPKFWYVVSKLLCVRYLPHQLLNAVNIEYAELMAMLYCICTGGYNWNLVKYNHGFLQRLSPHFKKKNYNRDVALVGPKAKGNKVYFSKNVDFRHWGTYIHSCICLYLHHTQYW